MKNLKSSALVASILASSTVLAMSTTAEAYTEPVHRWNLDEASGSATMDAVGGFTGVLFPSAKFAPGLVSNGIKLAPVSSTDTSASVMFPPSTLAFGTADFGVALWVRTSFHGTSGTAELFGNRTAVGYGNYVSLRMRADGTIVGEIDQDTSTNYHATVTSGAARVNDNNWHHVALVRRAGFVTLYIDGSPISVAIKPVANLTGMTTVRLGRILPATTPGVISVPIQVDNLAVYNYGLTTDDVRSAFLFTGARTKLGYPALARLFAPELRFDANAQGYPMSAQSYYDTIVATGSTGYMSNNDPDTVDDASVPTYYQITECGQQIRINYWWFYGFQNPCAAMFGAHKGDWEHVMVTLNEAATNVAAVTYYQHTGHYTRLAAGGVDFHNGLHPRVYVASNAHGSYYDSFQTDADICYAGYCVSGAIQCGYYTDKRSDLGASLFTWEHLVSLDDGAEPWMSFDLTTDFSWGIQTAPLTEDCHTHPTRSAPTCDMTACSGTEAVTGEDGCRDSQCFFGDGTGTYTCEDPVYDRIYVKSFTLPTHDLGLTH